MEKSTTFGPDMIAEEAAPALNREHLSLADIRALVGAQTKEKAKKLGAKKAAKAAAKQAVKAAVGRRPTEAQLREHIHSQTVVSVCTLDDGCVIEATMIGGLFTWKLDGVPAAVETVRARMIAEDKNEWEFVTADGVKSKMRRPSPKELQNVEASKERDEWNAKVEAKKAAKATKVVSEA
ncbi:hypothetical protein LXA47_31225 [Massilia sp. P8910]|uniref:hypothetical protein n=1 Tax=Massilia antarctica TaxID=2765360 RepID=UPI001E3DD090|nr:hypothetical protein [Massilia antarctica]MCE3608043.1 hypothetical protein [Massilia antarctica]